MPDIPNADMLDCQSEGVLSTLAGIAGVIMANETIREILSFENSLCGNILIINAENLLVKKIKLNKNKKCIKKIRCILN
jgi:adenylyltransferase/sulfurtransferase